MKSKIMGLLAVGLLAGAGSAHATGVVTFDGVTVGTTQNGWDGYYIWNYTATFDSTDGMDNGMFTFDDFDGVVGNTATPTDWQFVNDGFVFTGSRPGTTFSGFGIVSLYGEGAGTNYFWQNEIAYPDGQIQSGTGGPVMVACAPTVGWCRDGGGIPVPEPGTLALLGLGLTGLALSRKRKAG